MERSSAAEKLDRSRRSRSVPIELRVEPGRDVPIQPDPFGKRLADLLLATFMLTVTTPAWIVIALAIKLEDGGPVFYEQERWGRGGGRIRVKKFRSMVADSDEAHGIRQATEEDPRITRVGKLLRRFGLDELPQILSIWKGDMSFVGPRPLAIGEIVEDGNGDRLSWESMRGFDERLGVRPGLTSLATIYLPKDVHPKRKFRYDLLYVRRRTLAMDLKLIALSFWISLTGRWETRQKKV